MALFLCGGSDLLENKPISVTPKPTADQTITYSATSDGYDGYEKVTVTVPKYATLGTRSITTNGTQSVISGNNSYSAVNVNIRASSLITASPIWTGANDSSSFTFRSSASPNYSYIVIYLSGNRSAGQPDYGESTIWIPVNGGEVWGGYAAANWSADGWVRRNYCATYKATQTQLTRTWYDTGDMSPYSTPVVRKIYGVT